MQFLEQLYPRFWPPSTCSVQVGGAGCVAAHCFGPLLAEKTLYPIGPGKDASSMCMKGSPVGTIVKWEKSQRNLSQSTLDIAYHGLSINTTASGWPAATRHGDVFIFEL